MSAPLWDDGDFIDDCLQRGEPGRPAAHASTWRCRWCVHAQHGFACETCSCESSYTSRDDSWRPSLLSGQDRAIGELANRCGVDGWVATAVVKNVGLPKFRAFAIKKALLDPPTHSRDDE